MTGADDYIETERELLGEITLDTDDVVGPAVLDTLDLVLGRGEGVHLGAEGVGEEDCVVALC
jgi:hypothetical protein